MFCTQCGTNLPNDSQFCRSCGKTQGAVSAGGGTAAAPAPAPIPAPLAAAPARKSKVTVLLAILGVLLFLIWRAVGTDNVRTVVSTAARLPVTLDDQVENVRAASWKAIALNLPYSGTVSINLAVVSGNPLDVFLTTPDQTDAMKAGQWQDVKVFSGFSATKTKTYRRTQTLNQGSYYLVVRDTSLGILSSSASDISVKAELNP